MFDHLSEVELSEQLNEEKSPAIAVRHTRTIFLTRAPMHTRRCCYRSTAPSATPSAAPSATPSAAPTSTPHASVFSTKRRLHVFDHLSEAELDQLNEEKSHSQHATPAHVYFDARANALRDGAVTGPRPPRLLRRLATSASTLTVGASAGARKPSAGLAASGPWETVP